MSACGVAIRCHHDPLAGGQVVVLHHPGGVAGRRPKSVQGGIQTRWVVDDFAVRGEYPGGGHHLFGECLGTFDASRVLAGTEADDARGAQRVGHPEHQRHLGADDDHVCPDVAGQGDDGVPGGDVDRVLLGQPGGAGVAGSDDEPRDLRVSAERQQQGMFTGTGTDHQDAHDTSL